MRIAVIIIVILGSLVSAGLGAKWVSDYNGSKQELASLSETSKELGLDISSEMKELEKARNCGYALILCGIIALISVFLLRRLGKISAIIIIITGIIPVFFTAITLVFTFMLILGGILGFFVKPKAITA
ncbi:MAG TPA: hypothetical protein VIO64_14025 [Pseudobacteroides sp.]|uniref:hypothetical protein n=1 Tax=Pseudobacteroides sp. TaxID=1968840 RepID=UPI002F920389